MTKKEKQALHKRDRALHRDYVKKYRARKLDGLHPVEIKVRRLAKLVSVRYGCPDQASDLEQEALYSLAIKSRFEGRCSLDTYITKMLRNSALKENKPLVPGLFSYPSADEQGKPITKQRRMLMHSLDAQSEKESNVRLVETLANERTSSLANRAQEKIAKDEFMHEVATRPEIQGLIVEIILESEEEMTDRKIARELSQRLDRNVSRHEVQEILRRLRPLFEQSLWVS